MAKMILKQLMTVYLSANYRHLGLIRSSISVFKRDIVPVFIEFIGPNPGQISDGIKDIIFERHDHTNYIQTQHFSPQLKKKQDAYSGVNSACRENRQELDIRLSIYSGRGKHE